MPTTLPIDSLNEIFDDAAAAARETQQYLDSRSAEGAYAWYAIPRVSVSAKFALTKEQGGLVNVILGRTGKQQLTHELQFSLLAATKPDVKAAPAEPGFENIVVSEPPFLVGVDDRQRLGGIVIDALRGRRFVNGRFPDDPGPAGFIAEADEFENALTSSKDQGVVFLRLGANPERCLIVRLAGGGDHDGIFVVEPDAEVPVTAYDYLGSEQNAIWYEPFRFMAAAFRQWIASGLPGVTIPAASIPGAFGGIPFSELASGLWKSYLRAEGDASASPNVPGAPVVAYALRGVAAQLAYTVPTDSDDTGSPVIQSRVTLQVDAKDGLPLLRAQLVAPEFVLVNDARRQVLAAFKQSDNVVGAGTDALVLLSYQKQPAKPRFLVIWSGEITGGDLVEQRDFAFTCGMGSDGRLEDFKIALPLEDPVRGEATVLRKNYSGFHNFFHAVRVWDMNGGWLIPRTGHQ